MSFTNENPDFLIAHPADVASVMAGVIQPSRISQYKRLAEYLTGESMPESARTPWPALEAEQVRLREQFPDLHDPSLAVMPTNILLRWMDALAAENRCAVLVQTKHPGKPDPLLAFHKQHRQYEIVQLGRGDVTTAPQLLETISMGLLRYLTQWSSDEIGMRTPVQAINAMRTGAGLLDRAINTQADMGELLYLQLSTGDVPSDTGRIAFHYIERARSAIFAALDTGVFDGVQGRALDSAQVDECARYLEIAATSTALSTRLANSLDQEPGFGDQGGPAPSGPLG